MAFALKIVFLNSLPDNIVNVIATELLVENAYVHSIVRDNLKHFVPPPEAAYAQSILTRLRERESWIQAFEKALLRLV